MKRFILLYIAVVIAAVAFTAGWVAAMSNLTPPQPESPVEASLKAHPLWGMTLGSKRVYVAEKEAETVTVEAVRVEKDRAVYTLKTVDERGGTKFEDVFQNAEGVWHYQPDRRSPDDWYHPLKWPCKPGDWWLTNEVDGFGILIQRTCVGVETVTVPAGTFETYKVTEKNLHQTGIVEKTFWYAPKHGLIQHHIRIRTEDPSPTRDALFKLSSMQ